MPDEKNNLYLHEAVLLRSEYDRHISLLQGLLKSPEEKRGGFLSRDDSEMKKPADDFNQKELEETLKKLQVKRMMLNQEIQCANFAVKISFEGENISIAQALEMRKAIMEDAGRMAARVNESACIIVIHKEERDIVEKPRFAFSESYGEYRKLIRRLRGIETLIHQANHVNTVSFKDE